MDQPPFLKFLRDGLDGGGFETDDVLAAVLPLMRQVLGVHGAGQVAPLDGVSALALNDDRQLHFAPHRARATHKNYARVEVLQQSQSHAMEIVGESAHMVDLDAGAHTVTSAHVGQQGQEITRLVYLSGYTTWEHAIGHHDELTDILSLGLILACLGCGLDFTEPADVELFLRSRHNLFAINSRLNPVLSAVIVECTELNRHRRAQDLKAIIQRLETYREQRVDFDTSFLGIKGFKESPISGKRRIIQSHLRDRLFEISRRNRLIYFKPTLNTLNLTVASVPLLLDYRNIRLEQLFVWHAEIADLITRGAALPLGRYLRFEDAPYIPGVLDKIISEARSHRAEYGFAQLRLVLCFLHWHNLKEAPEERIHSPLLLLPVELSKKKGVRDSYVLQPSTSVVEVNPALRHHLRDLYNLDLPETFDLRETTLDQIYDALKAQIIASEPAIMLRKVDRPKIELIHERARQRADQYRRRMKIRAQPVRASGPIDYNYDREDFRPLGLRIFLERVRPSPIALRDLAGAPPMPRLPNIVAPSGDGAEKIIEIQREAFSLQEAGDGNAYSWDFDLCSITLGNFNYRKMTLVQDYSKLIDSEINSAAFDRIFSLAPRTADEPDAPLDLHEQCLIIPSDATQASAIARARSGKSYIIQGPPGTGKSQTITNLIADYVAQGKRVLFVCEKRAAIDIVFHRLRQQGLDELCCLIHDSQTDKKEFVQNLKQTYEKFLHEAQTQDGGVERARASALKAIEQQLSSLKRFSEAMSLPQPQAGMPLRRLLNRLVALRANKGPLVELSPELEEQLPDYSLWLQHGELVDRLAATLVELDAEPCFAAHPLRWLARDVLHAERPLEKLTTLLNHAEPMIESLETALELSGLPSDLWDTLEEIQAILNFASRIQPLAERDRLALLDPRSIPAQAFAVLSKDLNEQQRKCNDARERTAGWREPLTPDDTENALAQARTFQNSFLRFLQPGFWRLRKLLRARYDFSRHASEPAWVKILEELTASQRSAANLAALEARARAEWATEDPAAFVKLVVELRSSHEINHPSIRGLLPKLFESEGNVLAQSLAEIHARFGRLDATLRQLLIDHTEFDFPGLSEALQQLREQGSTLLELLPLLCEMLDLPESLGRALRRLSLPLPDFEGAVAQKSLRQLYRQDRALSRFEGRTLAQRTVELDRLFAELLRQNAAFNRARVRRQFLENVNRSSLPASQLSAEQKVFKKNYSAGRRDLEHEFGKSMRYRSIRDLAADNTGQVIKDLKPIWLMSPLSISDTLPLDPGLFDVVIFDEASQIPVEDAVPAIFRSNQVIVVGDEMQLPPTTFFASGSSSDETVTVEEEGETIEVDLDSDSFLTQAAQNLPSTLLAWHYRSRYESLISFSNAAFYSGNLFTIPDRQLPTDNSREIRVAAPDEGAANVEALLTRSISFHFLENGVYEQRRNAAEAEYIARLVRALLLRETELSIGIVAFSEAQQTEIEEALSRLGDDDTDFAARLEAEFTREENDQFCGLFVKNLENVQGDERDIIILSICYGYDRNRRMLMNFGPINQRGGEKRLNVIFSRSKHHMAIVSSIRHHDITNEYNDGANSLRNFLHYAEAVSRGDDAVARRVLENLNPLARKALAPQVTSDPVIEDIATALRARGHRVDLHVGQSRFRCDLAIRGSAEGTYQLGILVDTDEHYANPNLVERYVTQPGILRGFGWRVAFVLTKDWFQNRDAVLTRLERELKGVAPEATEPEPDLETEAKEEIEQPPALPPPAPGAAAPELPSPQAATCRRLEFIGGGSRKFWEVAQAGNSVTVRFGRLGTEGQSQTKTCVDEAAATHELQKLIAAKLKKGYVEVS
jgi:predicted DNA-binding WGR domain protein